MLNPYISKNGNLLPTKEAVIPIDDIHFTYGYGVYENLKVRNRILYFPEKHCERLTQSAKYVGIPLSYSKNEIQNQAEKLIKSIKEDSFNLKILLVGSKDGSDLYIMALPPKFPPKKLYTQGVKAITIEGERQFPNAKTLSMLQSYLAYTKAKKQDCYDALLVHSNGDIVEGTRTNLFFTDGKTIFTAPEKYILNGVTRTTVIKILKQEGIVVQEKILKKTDLKKYKGFFLSSTSSKIVPITQIGNIQIEIPEIVKKTIRIYNEFLEIYAKEATPIEYNPK